MKKILFAIPCLLMIAILVGMIYKNNQSEKQSEEKLNQILEEASGWEKEITEIHDELNQMKKEIREVDMNPSVIQVGFMPADASDVDKMKKMAEDSQLSLTLVIDCSLGNDVIEGILKKISWYQSEVVLTSMDQKLPSEDELREVRMLLSQYMMQVEAGYLLRIAQDIQDNEEKLPDSPGFYRYAEVHEMGMYENGCPYGTYFFLRDISSMKKNIQIMEENPTVALLVVDYSAIKNGNTSEEAITDILSYIKKQMDQGLLRTCSVSESMDLIVDCIKTIEQKQKEYDEYSAKQKIYIDELNEKIRNVYEKWN